VSAAELIKFLQSNAISGGIASDKAATGRGKPIAIVHHNLDTGDLLDALARGAGAIYEGTTEDGELPGRACDPGSKNV
jgi:hypothetical protein